MTERSFRLPERVLATTALAAALLWAALVLEFGGLHFDDFVSLAESHGALSPANWGGLANDGRWQPLKRATFDLLSRLAGLTFWPYALAVMAAHLAMAVGVASSARAIWHDRSSRLAGMVALASLNLSAYSIAYAATLHGIASVALTVWSVSQALHGGLARDARMGRLALAALAALSACLYKETAVMTPALAGFAVWLASRDRTIPLPAVMRIVGAPAAGVMAYLALRLIFDVPLIPSRGRYSGGRQWPFVLNALVVLAHVLPWAAAALIGSLRSFSGAWRGKAVDVAVLAVTALAMVFPTLFLSWRSPNFLYAAVPVAALAATDFARRALNPGLARFALALLVAATLAGSAASAALRGAHLWGPYSEASVSQWLAFPRQGGRVVWFDADSRARYGGLARTIGTGDRLSYALRLATGDPRVDAEICVSVLVSPPYVQQPGDELYLHSAGRLEPLVLPPPGNWYCHPP